MRAPANEGAFVIRQGALEMSNVDLTHEMTQLIATQRLMQFQARSISIADDMLGLANSIRG
jgi:flagellar basal-body rod protein FlgG